MALAPAIDAPIATSPATFSFGDHSAYISSNFTISSVISVLGVPGYDATTFTPASKAPLATAALPSNNFFIAYISFLLLFYFVLLCNNTAATIDFS